MGGSGGGQIHKKMPLKSILSQFRQTFFSFIGGEGGASVDGSNGWQLWVAVGCSGVKSSKFFFFLQIS